MQKVRSRFDRCEVLFGLSSMKSETAKSVGSRLMAARGGRSQGEIATDLGVHKNTYARWERDEADMPASALGRLASMGWSPLWLLTGEGEERLSSSVSAGAATDHALVVAREDPAAEARRDQRAADFGTTGTAIAQQGHLDEGALLQALKLVDEALDGRQIARDRRAELIGHVYALVIAPGELPSATITSLIRAASNSGDRNEGQDRPDSRDFARGRRGEGS